VRHPAARPSSRPRSTPPRPLGASTISTSPATTRGRTCPRCRSTRRRGRRWREAD